MLHHQWPWSMESHESTQDHARNNPTKAKNLTPSENIVFQQPRPLAHDVISVRGPLNYFA